MIREVTPRLSYSSIPLTISRGSLECWVKTTSDISTGSQESLTVTLLVSQDNVGKDEYTVDLGNNVKLFRSNIVQLILFSKKQWFHCNFNKNRWRKIVAEEQHHNPWQPDTWGGDIELDVVSWVLQVNLNVLTRTDESAPLQKRSIRSFHFDGSKKAYCIWLKTCRSFWIPFLEMKTEASLYFPKSSTLWQSTFNNSLWMSRPLVFSRS